MPKLRSRSASVSRSRDTSHPPTLERAAFEDDFEGALESPAAQPNNEGGRVFWENELISLKSFISQYTRENSAIIENLISENHIIRETIRKNHEENSANIENLISEDQTIIWFENLKCRLVIEWDYSLCM